MNFLHALCLFKALLLFFSTNFPGPMFIPCPTFIPDYKVITLKHNFSHSNSRKLLKENTIFNSWSHLRFGICSYFLSLIDHLGLKAIWKKSYNLVTRCLVLFFCQLILCFGTDLFGLTITCFNFPLFSV